jgi:hypothetical protein
MRSKVCTFAQSELFSFLCILFGMKKASEYHQHAGECRELAARATTDDQRQMLLKMAETWESLANERAARVAQKHRLEELLK